MTQEEKLLYEIDRRGGRINTFELMGLGISQYQARLKGLREKLAMKGIVLTEGQAIADRKRCFEYKILRPAQPLNLFGAETAEGRGFL